ncbi:MAG: metalloregulator ArsR/SmtB family transcription factor [bacterium]
MQTETFTKALADQTRLRLLVLLVDTPELCVCEFTQALDLSQPKISRHLAVLRDAGLLQSRRDGLWIYYRLHEAIPNWAADVLNALRKGSLNEAVFKEDLSRLEQSERLSINCASS